MWKENCGVLNNVKIGFMSFKVNLFTVPQLFFQCVRKKNMYTVIYSPVPVNGKQMLWLGLSHKQFKPIKAVLLEHGREGCNLICC